MVGKSSMKAAVLIEPERMVLEDRAVPALEPGSVLIRVRACAICGSDIRIFHSGNSRVRLPAVMGHETAGDVVAVGEFVTKFSPGDRVAVGADVPCGECEYCEAGFGNNCPVNYAMGYQFDGGFAEYVLLNRTVVQYGPVHRIPDHVTYDEGAMAEPLACVLNALNLTGICLGDTVVIIGAGPIGCMMIPAIRRMGAGKIIVIQRSRPRLEQARQFGADLYFSTEVEEPISRVLAETQGIGAHVVITANGNPDTQPEALAMVRNRGRVNFFGGLPADRSKVTLDTNLIHYKELTVTGAHGSTPAQHGKAVSLIADGLISVGNFISHRFPLDRIHEAFKVAESHRGMRVVIQPWQE